MGHPRKSLAEPLAAALATPQAPSGRGGFAWFGKPLAGQVSRACSGVIDRHVTPVASDSRRSDSTMTPSHDEERLMIEDRHDPLTSLNDEIDSAIRFLSNLSHRSMHSCCYRFRTHSDCWWCLDSFHGAILSVHPLNSLPLPISYRDRLGLTSSWWSDRIRCRRRGESPYRAWSEGSGRVSGSGLGVVWEGDLVFSAAMTYRPPVRDSGEDRGEGDRLPAGLMSDIEPRCDPARLPDSIGDSVARSPGSTIPSVQGRMVELESVRTISPASSTSSTLNPGPANDRDSVTTHRGLRLELDRRVHTCGQSISKGLS